MKLNNIKRIVVEDYPEEVRPSIEKLAYIINDFMSNVTDLANKKVDFDNLYREIVTVKVIVDSSGVPLKNTTFSTTYLPNAHGGVVIRAANLTNSQVYPSSAIFVSFLSTKNNLFKVNHVTGLTPGHTYELTLEIIGK